MLKIADRTFMGAQITLAWPVAALRPGAVKPSYEKWEAYLSTGERIAGFTLQEVKAGIRANGSFSSPPPAGGRSGC